MRIQHPAQFVAKSRLLRTCSRDALGQFLKEEEEEEEEDDGEFDQFSDWTLTVHLQYSKHIVE